MVRTGLDIFIHERLDSLEGRHVGLVTHPGAVLPDLTSAVDALLNAGVKLTALFGPEHGFDGSADSKNLIYLILALDIVQLPCVQMICLQILQTLFE